MSEEPKIPNVHNIPDAVMAERLRSMPKGMNPAEALEAMEALRKPGPDPRMLRREAPTAETIQLDEMMILRIELLTTQIKLAQLEEQNLLLALQGVRRRAKDLQTEETRLLEEIRNKTGIGPDKNIKLVDRGKGLCAVI